MILRFPEPLPIESVWIEEQNEQRQVFLEDESGETYQQAYDRILRRYATMDRLCRKTVQSQLVSLILSGPPGLGKSNAILQAIRNSSRQRHDGMTPVDPEIGAKDLYYRITGGCSAPGLFHSCWNMRHGGLLVIDDCDGVFADIDTINLLKLATDSCEERWLSWRKRSAWLDEFQINPTFRFEGHIIFSTNKDFEILIQHDKGREMIEHYKALIDRACYLPLTLRTQRDFLIRIRHVSEGPDGILQKRYGLTPDQSEELLAYIEHHKDKFHSLSIRLVEHAAHEMSTDPAFWQENVEATRMKTR